MDEFADGFAGAGVDADPRLGGADAAWDEVHGAVARETVARDELTALVFVAPHGEVGGSLAFLQEVLDDFSPFVTSAAALASDDGAGEGQGAVVDEGFEWLELAVFVLFYDVGPVQVHDAEAVGAAEDGFEAVGGAFVGAVVFEVFVECVLDTGDEALEALGDEAHLVADFVEVCVIFGFCFDGELDELVKRDKFIKSIELERGVGPGFVGAREFAAVGQVADAGFGTGGGDEPKENVFCLRLFVVYGGLELLEVGQVVLAGPTLVEVGLCLDFRWIGEDPKHDEPSLLGNEVRQAVHDSLALVPDVDFRLGQDIGIKAAGREVELAHDADVPAARLMRDEVDRQGSDRAVGQREADRFVDEAAAVEGCVVEHCVVRLHIFEDVGDAGPLATDAADTLQERIDAENGFATHDLAVDALLAEAAVDRRDEVEIWDGDSHFDDARGDDDERGAVVDGGLELFEEVLLLHLIAHDFAGEGKDAQGFAVASEVGGFEEVLEAVDVAFGTFVRIDHDEKATGAVFPVEDAIEYSLIVGVFRFGEVFRLRIRRDDGAAHEVEDAVVCLAAEVVHPDRVPALIGADEVDMETILEIGRVDGGRHVVDREAEVTREHDGELDFYGLFDGDVGFVDDDPVTTGDEFTAFDLDPEQAGRNEHDRCVGIDGAVAGDAAVEAKLFGVEGGFFFLGDLAAVALLEMIGVGTSPVIGGHAVHGVDEIFCDHDAGHHDPDSRNVVDDRIGGDIGEMAFATTQKNMRGDADGFTESGRRE